MAELNNEKEFVPEPAESFEIEYMNARGLEVQGAMLKMNFRFTEAKSEGDKVIIKGLSASGDGTTLEMIIKKGEGYKSPKEIADERAEQEKGE
jgi:hypothetical protein